VSLRDGESIGYAYLRIFSR